MEVASDIVNFTLEDLIVEVGARVVWTNRDAARHTSTSGSQGNKTGFWDGPPLAQDTSFAFTFTEVGTFQYFCAIHPTSMNATVVVMAQGALGAAAMPRTPIAEPQTSATPGPLVALPVATIAPVPAATPAPPTAAANDALFSPILDFTLENLFVEVGATIAWENQGAAAHTTTSGVSPDSDGIWDSGVLNTGEFFSFTFDEPGELPYWCTIHPFMTATITVTGGAPQSPTPAPAPPTSTPLPTPMPPQPVPPTPVPPTPTPAPSAGNIVNSPIMDFTLEDISVAVGTTIIWENQDAAPHTSTSGISPDRDDIWDSGILNNGESFSFTFQEVGEFAYFCAVHPYMTATVTVTDEQAAQPKPALPTPAPPTPIPPTATPSVSTQSVTVGPSKDNTLYESSTGALSNGAGQYMFVGNTAGSNSRRALIAFDLSGMPDGATINSVTLTLNMSKTSSGAQTVELHRLASDWGEGSSKAGGKQGAGIAPETGDATWV
ncbi:MAG: DNRLRE domain-containing protein, partial [Chloroflexi bacterium]|nr:DNRLRE domain-containing protein [Chloroflexota bacterium]